MDALKETAIETIGKMPDGCSLEDIMYELNFVGQVMDGLRDAEEGRLITTGELLKRVKRRSRTAFGASLSAKALS